MPLNSLDENFMKKKDASEISIEFARKTTKNLVQERWGKTETAKRRQITTHAETFILMFVMNGGLRAHKMRSFYRLLVALQKQAISGNVFHNSVCVCGRDLGSLLMVTVSLQSIRFQKMKESQKAKHLQKSTNSSNLKCMIYQMGT